MEREKDFSREGVYMTGGGIVPCSKSAALTTRYVGWWRNVGHRQQTVILEVYEKCDGGGEGQG